MRTKTTSFLQRPRWVAALVITMAVTVWSFLLNSMPGQIEIGRPFSGFFHTPCIHLFFICGHLFLILIYIAIGNFANFLPTN